jgi:hypothetical protein
VLNFLGEIGTLDPWLWRGWAYCFSSTYRVRRHEKWAHSSRLYAFTDIFLSLSVMALEITLVAYIVISIVGYNGGHS